MDGLLKVLIASACACVIAVSAHYGYSIFLAGQKADQQAKAARELLANEAEYRVRTKQQAEKLRAAAAIAALKADCDHKIPSQSTENLRAIYQRCLADNAANFGAVLSD